jgi:hypothetical protein
MDATNPWKDSPTAAASGNPTILLQRPLPQLLLAPSADDDDSTTTNYY